MKAADLREKTPEDLLELEKLLARDVFRNRLKNFTNRLDDTSAVRKTRRDLARVLTVLRQRQTASASEQTGAAVAEAPPPADSPAAGETGRRRKTAAEKDEAKER